MCSAECNAAVLLTLSPEPTEEGFFSHSKALFAVTLSGITEGNVPTELPSGRSTIQRPPTEREEEVHCVSEWRSVCLSGIDRRSRRCSRTERESRGRFSEAVFTGENVCYRVLLLLLLLDRSRLQSPPPGGKPKNLLKCYQNIIA